MSLQAKLGWAGLSILGAVAFAVVALFHGETVNAAWLVIAAVCIYLIAFRFYGLWIAGTVFGVDAKRTTPAVRHNDGLDYVPTNRYVLFGHHFAAIAGAGPLVGPVLAAQMGYLPGVLWILAGVVFAGAVQDMTVLFMSTRRDGRSLGDMIRSEMGTVAGTITITAKLTALGTDVTPSPAPTRSTRVPAAAPVIVSATATRNATGFAVTIVGYVTDREMTTAA